MLLTKPGQKIDYTRDPAGSFAGCKTSSYPAKADSTAHGSYYTLTASKNVKYQLDKFLLFLSLLSLVKASSGTVRPDALFWRQNTPFSFQNTASSLENSPFSSKNNSFSFQNKTFSQENNPFRQENTSFSLENNPFSQEYTSFSSNKETNA